MKELNKSSERFSPSKADVRNSKLYGWHGFFVMLTLAAVAVAFTVYRNQAESVTLPYSMLANEHRIVFTEGGARALGQFPPQTDAGRELQRILDGHDENIDLALAN